ncbi:isovaleryl-CoA dehydrogenase [Mesorhizobium sp. L-8-10]|uniref:acyl-CoA dehydrogenase family protein n=1 Tax=unclassified Mesorhizobium TaxID=325217 RepID=UPI0019274600|nr:MULTISPECIES: acyl-CoA dehydrogenase family protein [unclassified Mesorhizobium]BCH23879.1 isovaleryl-CoA dehydrogenase [Mesorhizobium sp. L-8-3]BCH31614.1 isovaleryl-CoA dehydrogenase [Mesorhizobium sp. L-8-10]
MPRAFFDDPDGTLAMLRDSVETLSARYAGPASLRAKRARQGDTDPALWAAMAEAGWTGLLLPEDLGGAGLGFAEQAVLSEALGRALICEPIAAGSVFASVLLREAPSSAERDRLAAGLADGSLRISPAWRQPSQHSSGRPLTASEDASGISLDGGLQFVDAAASATDFLVVAPLADGAVLVSVPASAPGVSLDQKAGVDGATIGALRFGRVFVPAERVLARAGSLDALVENAVLHARVALAAELAGIASKAVEMTIAYTRDRVQFGKPIASFQAVQHRLVDMWSDAEFACASVVNAVTRQSEGDDKEARLAVLAAKARGGDAATSICRRAVHLHGAMGFTDEHDIGLYLKRAIALSATLGQPEALRLEFVELERAA